ncbi:DsbA family protein [Planotetraspora mira]|nr:thioredoxin domain-containing protein [Planotetraspora mira]
MNSVDVPPSRSRTRRYSAMLVALAVIVVSLVANLSPQEPTAPARADAIEQLVTLRPDGSVMVARPGVVRPVLEVYEDFQCPVCQEFERGNGKVARQAVLRGEIALLIHPMTIFSESPMHENSHRALSASLCVTDPEKWLAYHDALYAGQPEETQDGGFAIADLVALAEKTGVPSADFADCLSSEDTSDKADEMSRAALRDAVQGTPTVRIDGQDIDWSAPWGGTEPDQATTV